MKNYEYMLNQKTFFLLKNIYIGDMLHYPLNEYRRKIYSVKSFLKFFAILIYRTIFQCNEICVEGNGEHIFFLSECDARKDQYDNFNNIFSAVDNYTRIMYRKRVGIHFELVLIVPLFFVWFCQCNSILKNVRQSLECASYIFIAFINYIEIKSYVCLSKINIKTVTTCNDVSPSGSLIVQFFNNENVLTATLQHGIFSYACNDWMLRGSHSKIYLAANQFTMYEASEIPHRNIIIPVGMTYSIRKKTIEPPCTYKNDIICVFLDGENWYESNIEMIRFVQEYCIKNNKYMYIKLHPMSYAAKDKYMKIADKRVLKKILCDEYSLNELIQYVDIAIVRNSTVLIQMLEYWIPSFIFCSELQSVDVYKNAEEEFRIRKESDLQIKVENILLPEFKDKMNTHRKNFYIEDAFKNYKKFYSDGWKER